MIHRSRFLTGLVFLLLFACLSMPVYGADEPESLFVHAGAGLKAAMLEIGDLFEEENGIAVEYNFAGAGTLITQMELSKKGDVFVSGGTPDYKVAQEKGLVIDPEYIAYHVPVIGVQAGNPLGIESIQDFTKEGIKLALGDVNATAIGKQGQKLFDKLGISEDVEKNVVVRAPTINEVVTALKLKQADASLITLDQIKGDDIEPVALPDEENIALVVPIGCTTFTTKEETAQKFVDFVSSDEGKAIFKKHGFPVYPDPVYANVML